MKKLVIASVMGLILAMAMSVPALADHPPESHHHHIHLPNGKCLSITSLHEGMKRADQTPAAVEIHHGFRHSCPD